MTTSEEHAAAQLLIHSTMELAEQCEALELLIRTMPPRSPSVLLDISPELALHILQTYNVNTRNSRPAKIKRFMLDMQQDEWLLGDTIKSNKKDETARRA